jgi:hypothetical protein
MTSKLEISDRSFDAETTAIISQAFESACREMLARGQPESLHDSIAKRLIVIAGRGERDPAKLSEAALISLGLKPNRFAI